MQGAREPSMEDILASIKKVIAEEKELRAAPPPPAPSARTEIEGDDDVLELDEPHTPEDEPVAGPAAAPEPVDLGPPLASEEAVDASRQRIAALQEVAAAAPPPPAVNPFEAMVREMIRPMLKEWLDAHLSDIVDEHVRREIGRITGTPL
jgi:cell pole-organizing protein PopZ